MSDSNLPFETARVEPLRALGLVATVFVLAADPMLRPDVALVLFTILLAGGRDDTLDDVAGRVLFETVPRRKTTADVCLRSMLAAAGGRVSVLEFCAELCIDN